jgi:cytosine/adenosine deaminase-related metal-dependent hydrolase
MKPRPRSTRAASNTACDHSIDCMQLELLGPNYIAVHMTQLTDEEIVQLAETGVSVVHCPESNPQVGQRVLPRWPAWLLPESMWLSASMARPAITTWM